jgi:hypothetical protein
MIHVTLLLTIFYRGFWPSAVSKSVAIASPSAAGRPQTATRENANVLGTMVAGHAVVVVCSANQDLAREIAGLNKYGYRIRNIAKRRSLLGC